MNETLQSQHHSPNTGVASGAELESPRHGPMPGGLLHFFAGKCFLLKQLRPQVIFVVWADLLQNGCRKTMKNGPKRKLSSGEVEELLVLLKIRFEKNMGRHRGINWTEVETNVKADTAKAWSLAKMEETGGEPDVVGQDEKTGEYFFFDCSEQSPKGRYSLCYDREGLEARKAHKPSDSAIDVATAMGVTLLSEEEYAFLQTLGPFDTKTSSWIETPAAMRKLGGALFGDRRFGRVFFYHNGAQSYYSGRGFRACLKV